MIQKRLHDADPLFDGEGIAVFDDEIVVVRGVDADGHVFDGGENIAHFSVKLLDGGMCRFDEIVHGLFGKVN